LKLHFLPFKQKIGCLGVGGNAVFFNGPSVIKRLSGAYVSFLLFKTLK
jgi:hypothetical protein